MVNVEQQRLDEADGRGVPWRRWGPYLSERQWGVVREDYSGGADARSSFTHDQARFRAYRWGEDGLAGFSDDRQLLCLALSLWNGRDLILKERLFGLTNAEGNHGEDVKECYFYLDATPTSSYLMMLYKHPQVEFPYAVVDVAFAKQQLGLLLDRRYLHPNGQLPAYEWNFSDVNPPVHAWATLFVYEIEKAMTGTGDSAFLENAFQKLMKNFGWWLNRKDPVLFALFDETRLRRILAPMLDGDEFLGPHGIRSVSRWHAEHPYVIFYEYFHGDNGAGIGASHQTGWTGTVGLLTLLFGGASAERLRARIRGVSRTPRPQRTAVAQ